MRPLFLLLVLLGTASAPLAAQEPPSRMRFAWWIYEDAAALVFEKAAPNAPRYAVQGLLLLVPVTLLDGPVNDYVEEGHRGVFADYVRLTNEIGGTRATLPVAALFGVSLFTSDTRLQDAAFTSLESLLYAGALAYGVKYTVGRVRPEDTSSPYVLRPFSGNTSFPSGHATTAFAVLTPWALYYPHPVTYAAVVLLGSGTAFSRIARERHWMTDVIGGAAIGIVTAHYLVHRHTEGERGGGASFEITPAPEGIRATLRLRW